MSEPDVKANDSVLPQSATVVQGVKRLVVSGELRPGDRLPIEKDLAVWAAIRRPGDHRLAQDLVRSLGVADAIERVDLLLRLLQRRGQELLADESARGPVGPFGLALRVQLVSGALRPTGSFPVEAHADESCCRRMGP